MRCNEQAGSTAILAVVALALLCVIGAAMVPLTATEAAMAAGYRDGMAAQYLAESGARWGLDYLQAQLADSGNGMAILAETNSTAGKSYAVMGRGPGALFGSGATAGTISVVIKRDPTDPANADKRVIVATAAVGSGKPVRRQVVIPVMLTFMETGLLQPTSGLWRNH